MDDSPKQVGVREHARVPTRCANREVTKNNFLGGMRSRRKVYVYTPRTCGVGIPIRVLSTVRACTCLLCHFLSLLAILGPTHSFRAGLQVKRPGWCGSRLHYKCFKCRLRALPPSSVLPTPGSLDTANHPDPLTTPSSAGAIAAWPRRG